MTWQPFPRGSVFALVGVAALALAPRAEAEAGDGPSVIPPDQAEAFLEKLKAPDGVAAHAEPENQQGVEAKAAIRPEQPDIKKARSGEAGKVNAFRPLIARYASENGLPYELADAVVRLESRYNPGARNGPNMGLTQINFRTAQSLGYQGSAAGLLDAETNLRYGLKYLAQAYKLAGGDTCGTILRYQFGHRTQTMTKASRAYCAKVKTITAVAD